MNTGGWIKIHRKIKDKGYYKKSEYIHLWIHLLLEANRDAKEFMWNGSVMKLKSGQFITGRKSLSSETGINESKVERILKVFENEQQIEQQKTTKFRLITIKNWSDYQKIEQQIDQQVNNKRTTSEQQLNTNKNIENIKNKENITIQQPEAAGVNKLFDIFYKINPTINYGNKTQRLAAERLIKKLGEEKAIKSSEAAIAVHGQKFAPTITTPIQLENKLSELIAFYKKNQTNQIISI